MTLPVSGSPSTQRRGDERLPDGAPPHTWWYPVRIIMAAIGGEGKWSTMILLPLFETKTKTLFLKTESQSLMYFMSPLPIAEGKQKRTTERNKFLQSEKVANNKWWPLILVATVANWHFVWVFNTDWSGCVCVCFVKVVTDRCLPRPIKSTDDKCISNLPNNQLVWRSIQGWLNKFIAILNANSWHA